MIKEAFCALLIHLCAIALSCAVYFIFVPIFFIIFLWRLFVQVAAQILRPDLDSIVSARDAFFVHDDNNKSQDEIVISFVVNNSVSEHRIREMFQQRVFNLKDSDGLLAYKRLLQYWTRFWGYSFWKTDEDFDVCNHVRKFDYNKLGLPSPTNESLIKSVLPKLRDISWKPSRSHWETLIVSSYEFNNNSKSESVSKNCTLLIFRFDHFLLDGLSAISLFRVLFQSEFKIPRPRRNERKLSILERVVVLIYLPLHILKPILFTRRHLSTRADSGQLIYDFSENIPVSLVKKIKDAHGVGFPAVGTSAINASICRCLKQGGKNAPPSLDVISVLAHPDHTGVMCNYGILAKGNFPLEATSSADRLRQTDTVSKHISVDVGLSAKANVVVLLGLLPAAVAGKIFSSAFKHGPGYMIGPLPTTTSAEYVDDVEIVDVFGFAILRSGLEMNIYTWGVNNQQRFNFLVDKNVFGDDSNIGHVFTEELKKLTTTEL
ncbi:unnamed protein product [Allacma fusca]|uniref:O-acyltransferase WSD1 C-terminal domain-containing protein n=1 Tax=Allacma fusca TaxID=39272 RepID=A0A8J2PGU1_9HEXA|nr:unnamed protein product [Allacma fusca]